MLDVVRHLTPEPLRSAVNGAAGHVASHAAKDTTTSACKIAPRIVPVLVLLLGLVADRTLAQNVAADFAGGTAGLGMHYPPASLPIGAAGTSRLRKGGGVVGYFQPIAVTAEQAGVQVAPAVNGRFLEPQPTPFQAGMLIGSAYRLRVTNIPAYPGRELFPTIEVIDRLYPPPGQERKFPIPIELTAEDLELALAGHFITRVIYVEDPQQALPVVGQAEHPSWYDVGPGANPLLEADRLGRPVAILRMGGRLPDDRRGADQAFLFGSPPLMVFRPLERLPARHAEEVTPASTVDVVSDADAISTDAAPANPRPEAGTNGQQ
jgi:hypothetical protein